MIFVWPAISQYIFTEISHHFLWVKPHWIPVIQNLLLVKSHDIQPNKSPTVSWLNPVNPVFLSSVSPVKCQGFIAARPKKIHGIEDHTFAPGQRPTHSSSFWLRDFKVQSLCVYCILMRLCTPMYMPSETYKESLVFVDFLQAISTNGVCSHLWCRHAASEEMNLLGTIPAGPLLGISNMYIYIYICKEEKW